MAVMIYGQKGCPECVNFVAYCEENKVSYVYRDIHDPEIDQMIASEVMSQSIFHNQGKLPMVEVEGVMYGEADARKNIEAQD